MAGRAAEIIDLEGNFKDTALQKFGKAWAKARNSYMVVSVIGSRSPGKSFLLNEVFKTHSPQTDRRYRVSLERAKAHRAMMTVVMNLDQGTEIGDEIDRHATLFAVVVSDIVLINMDAAEVMVQYEQLKSVFEVVLHMSDSPNPALMFVLHGEPSSETFDLHNRYITNSLQEIWQDICATMTKPLKVKIVAFDSFDGEETDREKLMRLEGGMNSFIDPFTRKPLVPAVGLPYSLKRIWETIRRKENLNLSNVKDFVASEVCDEIIQAKLKQFRESQEFLQVQQAVTDGSSVGSDNSLSLIFQTCLSGYDIETSSLEHDLEKPLPVETDGSSKRNKLEKSLINELKINPNLYLEYIRSVVFYRFKAAALELVEEGFESSAVNCINSYLSEFDAKLAEEASIGVDNLEEFAPRIQLSASMQEIIETLRNEKLDAILKYCKDELDKTLRVEVIYSLRAGNSKSWSFIRKRVKKATEEAFRQYSARIIDMGIKTKKHKDKFLILKEYAHGIVDFEARNEAQNVLLYMHDRFLAKFQMDRGVPRAWREKENIPKITVEAYTWAARVLSVFAAVRLESKDNIESTLLRALVGSKKRDLKAGHLLAENTWKGVPAGRTIYTPLECLKLWKYLKDGPEEPPAATTTVPSGGDSSYGGLPEEPSFAYRLSMGSPREFIRSRQPNIRVQPRGTEYYIKDARKEQGDYKQSKMFRLRDVCIEPGLAYDA